MFRRAGVPAQAEKPRASVAPALWRGLRRGTARAIDAATLNAHALAVRLDYVPQEFGASEPVDEADPRAVRREWRRQFHQWAAYNPEEIFALKAGALILGAALVGLVVFIAAI